MTLAYYVSTQGSDVNSGSAESVIGAGIGAATDGSATVQLPGGTNLAGVNQGKHDTVRLAGRSDGLHGTDLFEIMMVDDANDRLAVSPSPGVGSNQSWIIGGAFATPQRAADVVDPSGTIWIKADGDYLPDGGPIIQLKQAGSGISPIFIEGYVDTPGDATAWFNAHPWLRPSDPLCTPYRARLNCNNEGQPAITQGTLSGKLHYVLRNLDAVNQNGGQTIMVDNAVTLFNVAIRDSLVGLYCGGTTANGPVLAVNGLFEGISLYGASGGIDAIGCEFINGDGTAYTGLGKLLFCRLINNHGTGISINFATDAVIAHCTILGSSLALGRDETGIALSSTGQALVLNNIVASYGVGIEAATPSGPVLAVHHNLIAACPTSYRNVTLGVGNLVADDPGFVDGVGGDCRLRVTSPAVHQAWPSGDLGAWQRLSGHHGLLRLGAG